MVSFFRKIMTSLSRHHLTENSTHLLHCLRNHFVQPALMVCLAEFAERMQPFITDNFEGCNKGGGGQCFHEQYRISCKEQSTRHSPGVRKPIRLCCFCMQLGITKDRTYYLLNLISLRRFQLYGRIEYAYKCPKETR